MFQCQACHSDMNHAICILAKVSNYGTRGRFKKNSCYETFTKLTRKIIF